MKDMTIKLSANEASGEAYWRKRCDAVEAELTRLRAENEELKANVLLLQTEYLRQNPCTDPQDDIDELERKMDSLRAVNAELVEVLKAGLELMPLGTAKRADWLVKAGNIIFLSRAEQAKPESETCVWELYPDPDEDDEDIYHWRSACGRPYKKRYDGLHKFCPFCCRRIQELEHNATMYLDLRPTQEIVDDMNALHLHLHFLQSAKTFVS